MDRRHNVHQYFEGQTYTWETAWFTVPASVSDERVQVLGDRYRRKWGYHLETPQPYGPGFTVLYMEGPVLDTSIAGRAMTEPDRRRYVLWAKVTRAPVTTHVDVPDEDVPLFLAHGYTLKE